MSQFRTSLKTIAASKIVAYYGLANENETGPQTIEPAIFQRVLERHGNLSKDARHDPSEERVRRNSGGATAIVSIDNVRQRARVDPAEGDVSICNVNTRTENVHGKEACEEERGAYCGDMDAELGQPPVCHDRKREEHERDLSAHEACLHI